MYPDSLQQKLTQLLQSISGFTPEIGLAILFVVLIVVDLFTVKKSSLAFVTLLGLVVIGYVVWEQWVTVTASISLFLGMLQLDKIGVFFKFIFILSGILLVLLSLSATSSKESTSGGKGEYYALLVAMLLGLHLMAMSVNLLMLYLAIELVSISSYVLTTFRFTKQGTEGGLKYLLFGALSSGIMLYGMSLLYGFTGTLYFTEPAFLNGLAQLSDLPLIVAVFLTLGGLFFKIAVVPFHIWTPDVYESAPTPVVAFFSVAPKAAAFLVLLRLFHLHLPDFSPFQQTELWAAIAILTLTVGNFSALWQKNAKRMLAYSSIAHAGFLFIGVLALNQLGWQSLLFYAVVYLFMNFAAFLIIDVLDKRIDSQNIEDYSGLGLQYPFLGVSALLIMVALTGLPPTAGFTAKLFIFSSLWQSYQHSGDTWLLALFIWGLLNVAVALFYYLKIPFFMFFRKRNELIYANLGIYDRVLISLLLIPLLLFFFKSDWLMNWITHIRF